MHKVYETPESGKEDAVLIDSVYLHKFLYFAASTDNTKVYKVSGNPLYQSDLKVELVIDTEV